MNTKVAAVLVGSSFPLLALLVAFGLAENPAIFIVEGGVWSLAVLACTFVFGLMTPAFAAFVPVPRSVWAALALAPVCVGVLGTVIGVNLVAGAIAMVNPADKLMMAYAGAGEVASILSLALVLGGAGVGGVALVIVVVEPGLGGVLLLASAGSCAVFGVRWFALRQGMSVIVASDPAFKASMLAGAVEWANVLGVVVVVVAAVLLLGGLASLRRRAPWAPLSSNVALSLLALLLPAVAAAGHLSISGLPAVALHSLPPLPSPLLGFEGQHTGIPDLFIKVGGVEVLQGEPGVVVVDPSSRGVDVRRGLEHIAQARGDEQGRLRTVIFVGRGPPRGLMPYDFSMPAVFEPWFLHERTMGVFTQLLIRAEPCPSGSVWPCDGAAEPGTQVVIVGPSRPASEVNVGAVRYLLGSGDGPLDLKPGSVSLAFDDDIAAATFASVLQRLAAPGEGEARAVILIKDAPPTLAQLSASPAIDANGAHADNGIGPSVIARVMRSHQRQLKSCFEAGLQKNPKLNGKVSVVFTVDANGRVQVNEIEGDLAALSPCLKAEFATWRFPAPTDGHDVVVRVPLVFDAGS